MTASWEQAGIFPVIARLIESRFSLKSDFVTHDEIVDALVDDGEAAAMIAEAQQHANEERTPHWIAHNMVAWFSQKITVGESDWRDRFDRTRIEGKWAYRPKQPQ